MTRVAAPFGQRRALGITEGLVRVSAGIEDVDDLKGDLAQALDSVWTARRTRPRRDEPTE